QGRAGGAFRLGISGVPGVGKSTFIESLGQHVIAQGHRVAVLAVDPSSPKTGGSILGDKTRMEQLSRHAEAFIRPSPSGGTLGGVTRRTRDVMVAVEAAGFDVVFVEVHFDHPDGFVVFVETVGVGQSETAVAGMTDMVVLLLAPGAGDDLQGIKKGIVELADLIVVNKADGDLLPAAERARRDYAAALHLLRPAPGAWQTGVMTCSAIEDRGVAAVWTAAQDFRAAAEATGRLSESRADQAAAWMWDEVTESLLDELRGDPASAARIAELEQAERDGTTSAAAAAKALLAGFRGAS
ncbi:MAG: methylmalonyl Co-A mutase-associated GTPase MeaB, partial [Rhodospirillaceae bacterium]